MICFEPTWRRAQAGSGFFASIEPNFNRLVVFDDRMPHGVERVDGSMDPVEGRFVLHGHLRDKGAIVSGALTEQQVGEVVMEALIGFSSDVAFAPSVIPRAGRASAVD